MSREWPPSYPLVMTMKADSQFLRALVVAALTVLAAAPSLGQEQAPPAETPPAQPPQDRPTDPTPNPEANPEATPEAKPEAKPAAPSVDPALREMFRQAAQRLQDAKSISFHGKTSHTGSIVGKTGAADANVRMVRVEVPSPHWRFRSTGTGGRTPDEAVPFDVTWDRQRVSWLDTPAKKLIERPFTGPKAQIVQSALVSVPTQMQESTPFSREITAEGMTLEGNEAAGGVTCDIVAVRYKAKGGVIKFWLAETDRLPRKIERVSESTTYPNSTTYELTDLKLDEPLTEEQMTIALPEGFERDSTAPAAPIGTPATVTPGLGTPPAPAAPPTEHFPAAPEFELTAPDGTTVNPASLKGSVVVLYFWGTWSLPSRAADPEVQALHEKYKDRGVKVLGMSVREKTREAPAEFLASLKRAYTNLPDADAVARRYAIIRYPTFVVIDGQWRRRATIEGFKADTTPDELKAAVENLLGAAAPGGGSP